MQVKDVLKLLYFQHSLTKSSNNRFFAAYFAKSNCKSKYFIKVRPGKRTKIIELLSTAPVGEKVIVKGWVRTFRNNQFIALNDGSALENIQVVVNYEDLDQSILKRITTGACVSITGEVVESQGKGQQIEITAQKVDILGDADAEKYPLQPKKHTLEFLRKIAHLRVRTNTFGAIYRVRHAMIFAVHKFFTEKGFYNIHTPIVTGSDAEGAGEMFRVTTLDPANPAKTDNGEVDYSKDFFGKRNQPDCIWSAGGRNSMPGIIRCLYIRPHIQGRKL